MRIFLDTNVILENFLAREDFKTAHNLFHAMQGQKHELFMSVGSFYTMIFLVDKYLRKVVGLIGDERVKMLRQMMSNILQTVSVAEHDNESLLRGIKNEAFKDVEDGCLYAMVLDDIDDLCHERSCLPSEGAAWLEDDAEVGIALVKSL